jgi:dodecin
MWGASTPLSERCSSCRGCEVTGIEGVGIRRRPRPVARPMLVTITLGDANSALRVPAWPQTGAVTGGQHGQTVKIIELVGVSPKPWHDAVEEALQEAAKTLHGIHGIDVVSTTAAVKDNKITEYRATVKVAFLVEKSKK